MDPANPRRSRWPSTLPSSKSARYAGDRTAARLCYACRGGSGRVTTPPGSGAGSWTIEFPIGPCHFPACLGQRTAQMQPAPLAVPHCMCTGHGLSFSRSPSKHCAAVQARAQAAAVAWQQRCCAELHTPAARPIKSRDALSASGPHVHACTAALLPARQRRATDLNAAPCRSAKPLIDAPTLNTCMLRRRAEWGRHFLCWHAGSSRQVHVRLVPRPWRLRDAEGLTDQVGTSLASSPQTCPRPPRRGLRAAMPVDWRLSG